MDKEFEIELQNARQHEKLSEFQVSIIISAERLIGPLFPFFCIADYLYAPGHVMDFLPFRLSVSFYCIVIGQIARRVNSLQKAEALALLLLLYPSIIITYLTLKTGGIASGYYAGLNLIAAGGIYFFPWTKKSAALAILAVYGPYILSVPFISYSITDLKIFAVNCIFIIGNVVVALVIRHIYETLKIKEIKTKINLKNEIQSRNKIITEKTNEAVRLSTLTKQFSPQVVHEISKGNLDIMKSHKRAKICTLFVDIVNSTDRVNRIDKDDLDKIITTFMEDTMRVLLKYDITIDKFLGDGVLAFSNAPIERSDYVERVVNAALEIRDRILLNREKYIEHWLNELQIRVGISVGYANVGFYGSEEYFRSYTAIGRVVNMASRICASADPGQVLVDNDVVKAIDISQYSMTEVGYKKLKGFEQDIIKIFEINKNANDLIDHNVPACPNGHGILHFDTNAKGIYELKCRNCGYVYAETLAAKNDVKKAS